MPVARNDDHRIAAGWITSTALVAGSSYLITGFTVVADQIIDNQVAAPWLAPVNVSPQTPTLTNYEQTLSGKTIGYGFRDISWQFSYWTFGQVGTWEALYGGTLDNGAQVTLLTYDENNVATYLQGYMAPLRLPGENGEPEIGGFKNIKIFFYGCQRIAAP